MGSTADGALQTRTAEIRRFNRFYTTQLGLLDKGLLESPYSLTEVRVLYELAQREAPTAAELGRDLDLDPGYMSRILTKLARRGLLRKRPSPMDGRQVLLELTKKGRAVFSGLDARADAQVQQILSSLPDADRDRLVMAMKAIEEVLGASPRAPRPIVLRTHRVGDMGWIVHRHGALYAREYGWNEEFEALVATIVAEFIHHHDPKVERCWIAEMGGNPAGSVFLVRKTAEVAQLRLLLVEPWARGAGIGGLLVDECTGFARGAGYRKIRLWTNSVLIQARRIYERAGYRLVCEEAHQSFGRDLVGQTWELEL